MSILKWIHGYHRWHIYFGEEVEEDIPKDEVEDTPATSKNAKPT